MFLPVSKQPYWLLEPSAQAIVVVCPILRRLDEVRGRWGKRACAAIHDANDVVRDVVRDLLANPQVRVVVFDGPSHGRAAWDAFWGSADFPDWKIDREHLSLVRQYVELYDDDFGIKTALQPFWPTRIRYTEET